MEKEDKMNWDKLLSTKRTGELDKDIKSHDRTQFQRDFDRLVFSSPFRRMQDKTQVFPLPGSVFVHNRLTHSLEVASVGRSLGNNLSKFLFEDKKEKNDLISELGAITAAACLAHDMGNPPFGHSGETAISHFFKHGEGKVYEKQVDNPQIWSDFTNFEGNANAFRLLTHQFNGRRVGGFRMTYTTVASIVKYPYASGHDGLKKYGYFNSEENTYYDVAELLGIPQVSSNPTQYARHPLVFLVEAADDICYQVMDIEDAHKLGILSFEETKELFFNFFNEDEKYKIYLKNICETVTDKNEQIAFLRANVIGKLVNLTSDIFIANYDEIMSGTFNGSLIKKMTGEPYIAMQKCIETGINIIYCHPSVVEVEISGFKILGTLLREFTKAVMNPSDEYAGLLLPFMPLQYKVGVDASVSEKIQAVLDFISGMTDVYALELFRKINGIGLADKRFY